MGKKRSGNEVFVKHRKSVKTRAKQRLTRRTRLTCPICFRSEMFVKVIQKQVDYEKMPKLYLIGCKRCNVGDVMPWHPTWTVTDMYNFVADYWRDPRKEDVVLKYPRMRRKIFDFFMKHVTYGVIKVDTIIEPKEGESRE